MLESKERGWKTKLSAYGLATDALFGCIIL